MINFKQIIINTLFKPPKFVINILPLNLLGLQILRIIFYNYKLKIKKIFINNKCESQNKKILSDMEEKGFTVIENFFSNKDYDFIKETTQKIEDENVFEDLNYGNVDVLIGPLNFTNKYKIDASKINKLFYEKNITSIISKIIGEKISYFPISTYQKISLKENLIDKDDVNSEFHPDKFYPCIKSFYYLNDNKLENGAFWYYPKSHKLHLDRIKYEYFHSILSGTNLTDSIYSKFNFEKLNGRVTLSRKKLFEIYGEPVVCEAPQNSLVLSNNMGFHKRGKMEPKNTRIHLRNSFYDFQVNSILIKIKNNYLKRLKK